YRGCARAAPRRSPSWLASRPEELRVPGDRPPEPLVEGEERLPPEDPAGFLRTEILMADLVARLVEDLRPELGAGPCEHPLHQLQDRDLQPVREVEGLRPHP